MPGPEDRDQDEQRQRDQEQRDQRKKTLRYDDTEAGIAHSRFGYINRVRYVAQRLTTHDTKPFALTTVRDLQTEAKEWPKKFESSLIGLMRVVTDSEKLSIYQTETNDFYEEVMDVTNALNEIEKKLAPPTPPTNPNGNTNSQRDTVVKLPRLDLPTFDGEILQWKNFFDMFSASVHSSQSLSKIQKFTYLKAALSGEAEASIADLSLSDANYDVAIKTLTDRYENPRRIKLAVVHDFLSYKQPKGADGLRGLVDKFNQMYRIFTSLNMTNESMFEALCIYHLQEKMDKEATNQWMLTWKDKDLPSLNQLKEFLAEHAERRIARDDAARQLKTVTSHHTEKHDNTGKKDNKSGSQGRNDKFRGRPASNQKSNFASKCNFGCSQSHPPWTCQQLLSTRPEDRFDFVRQRNLCVICLGKHRFADCTSNRTCSKCNGKHNSVLHFDVWKTQHQGTTYFTANYGAQGGPTFQPEPSYAETFAHTVQSGGAVAGPSQQ